MSIREKFSKVGEKVIQTFRPKTGLKEMNIVKANERIAELESKLGDREPMFEPVAPVKAAAPVNTMRASAGAPSAPSTANSSNLDALVTQAKTLSAKAEAEAKQKEAKKQEALKKLLSMPIKWSMDDTDEIIYAKIEKFEAEEKARLEAEARLAKAIFDTTESDYFYSSPERSVKGVAYRIGVQDYSLMLDANGKFSRVLIKRQYVVGSLQNPAWQVLTWNKAHLTDFDFKVLIAIKPTFDQIKSVYQLSFPASQDKIEVISESVIW
jgi:hypothetical protein